MSGGVLGGGLAHRAGAPVAASGVDGHGAQVGALRADEGELDEVTDRQVGGHVHDAVDLGGLVHRAAAAGRVDEDLARLTDERVALGGGDGVLQLGALAQPLEGKAGRDLVGQAGGVGAVLPREGEEAGPVELGRGEELEEQVVVALGLAGVAEDERRAEGGGRLGGADVGDAAQEALAVAPAPHARQVRTGHVLEGEVEVGHVRIEDGADQFVGEARRVQVEEPRALDALATRRG